MLSPGFLVQSSVPPPQGFPNVSQEFTAGTSAFEKVQYHVSYCDTINAIRLDTPPLVASYAETRGVVCPHVEKYQNLTKMLGFSTGQKFSPLCGKIAPKQGWLSTWGGVQANIIDQSDKNYFKIHFQKNKNFFLKINLIIFFENKFEKCFYFFLKFF